jgi:hypothetical protein
MKVTTRFALLTLLGVTSAHAAYFCTGTVTSVAVATNGTVTVTGIQGLESAALCNITGTANSITPELCRTIYATLLTAKLTNRPVTFAYNDALSCSTHPAWGVLTGWYFGPRVE